MARFSGRVGACRPCGPTNHDLGRVAGHLTVRPGAWRRNDQWNRYSDVPMSAQTSFTRRSGRGAPKSARRDGSEWSRRQLGRSEERDGTGRSIGSPERGRPRSVGRELAWRLDPAVAVPVPAPVELGLGVHGPGSLLVRRAARTAGTTLAVQCPVGERQGPTHRVQPLRRGGRLFPGPDLLGIVEAIGRRAARHRDLRHHPAADPCPGGTRDAPPCQRHRCFQGIPDLAVSEARGRTGLSGPRSRSGRDRAAGHRPPVGIRSRQLARLGPRPDRDGHPRRRGPAVRSARPGPRRSEGPADR